MFAFATALPTSIFNGCIAVEPSTDADLDAAITWVNEQGHPFRVWIDAERAGDLRASILAHGLVLEQAAYPGMVLHRIPEPPLPAPGVSVAPVTSAAGLEEHIRARIAGGMPEEFARRLIPPAMASDPDITVFTGYLHGRAVGVSMAIRTATVGGAYAVGTLADARQRGVGAATTWACVGAARAWGLPAVVLQASEMGFPLYRSMRFRTVVSYAMYCEATPPATPG